MLDRADDLAAMTVLDPEGKPVARAKLYMPRSLGLLGERPHEKDIVARGVTDAEGRFQLKLPRKEAQPGGPPPLDRGEEPKVGAER